MPATANEYKDQAVGFAQQTITRCTHIIEGITHYPLVFGDTYVVAFHNGGEVYGYAGEVAQTPDASGCHRVAVRSADRAVEYSLDAATEVAADITAHAASDRITAYPVRRIDAARDQIAKSREILSLLA